MSLEPLLAAGPVIRVHAFAAMAAFLLGGIQLMAPKGTLPHRIVGWTWVGLMLIIGVSAFFIHEIRMWGSVEPDPSARDLHPGHAAGRHAPCPPPRDQGAPQDDARTVHRRPRGRGLFTFVPGRIMYHVVFGP
jgi:uncharacterized membrane protein